MTDTSDFLTRGKPTPQDFFHTANVLQDVACISGTGGKVGNPASFPKNDIFRLSDLIFDGNLIAQKQGDKIRISVKETANESNFAEMMYLALKPFADLINQIDDQDYGELVKFRRAVRFTLDIILYRNAVRAISTYEAFKKIGAK